MRTAPALRPHRRLLWAAFLLAAPAAGAPSPAAHAAAPSPELPIPAPHLIHGEAANVRLEVVATGDVNGDGAADLVMGYVAQRGARGIGQLGVALGRTDWPESVVRTKLDRQYSLGFPDRLIDQLNDDTYELHAVRDYDGDGIDDIAIEVNERSQAETVAVAVRVYRGRRDFGAINVQSGRPDFEVRQGQVPRTPAQERLNAMPDLVTAGDFDGDGDRDIAVASCAAGGVRYEGEQVGAVRIYWSDAGGPSTIDLKRPPDVAIHGQPGLQLGCFGMDVADLDADGADDLVLFGSSLATFGGSHGAVIYGRPTWPRTAEVEDIADLRLDHDAPDGGLRIVRLVDANGDDRPDILAEFGTVRTVEGQCLWYTAGRPIGRRTTDSCDVRFTGLSADDFVDLDADGRPDLVYAAHRTQGRTDPFAWRVRFGPLTPGAHDLTGLPDDGDATITQPYGVGNPPIWSFADVNGDGRVDLLQSTSQAPSPDGAEQAGTITVHLGPLLDRAALPTATAAPASPSPPATATAATTPASTPTGAPAATEPPTARPTTAGTARIYLPLAKTGRPD
ncbi:MAG: VCBS repeat-containing protein [Ardenticatenales bacterium]